MRVCACERMTTRFSNVLTTRSCVLRKQAPIIHREISGLSTRVLEVFRVKKKRHKNRVRIKLVLDYNSFLIRHFAECKTRRGKSSVELLRTRHALGLRIRLLTLRDGKRSVLLKGFEFSPRRRRSVHCRRRRRHRHNACANEQTTRLLLNQRNQFRPNCCIR